MEHTYRANGKLLLSGEYFVLDGAKALTLPLNKAQELSVTHLTGNEIPFIEWKAFENGTLWFAASFNREFEIIENSDRLIAMHLVKIFKHIYSSKSTVFDVFPAFQFKSTLEFSRSWGLGSSSTLIHLLASWASLDPMQLHFDISDGSGYDVAAASQSKPFIYRVLNETASISPVQLQQSIASSLYFAYLGNKQVSQNEVVSYRSQKRPSEKIINHISSLTESMVSCSDLDEFENMIGEHEQIVSDFLNRKRINQELFSDYWGSVKSLGAWGGDFALFTHRGEFEELKIYLIQKGIQTFFAYDDLVLDS